MGNSRVEDTYFPRNRHIRIGDKLVDMNHPRIMGIINTTPDSFYASSRKQNLADILEQVDKMLQEGADMIDIGGYSTRPGADPVDQEEELARIIPVLQEVQKEFPGIIISLDTFRGKVAEEGLLAGASIINDISGVRFDESLIDVLKKYCPPYVLMHSTGTVNDLHSVPRYDNVTREVITYLSQKIRLLREHGITDIIVDPGFGFNKSLEENYTLLKNLREFQLLGCPVLVGVSRKSMIRQKLEIDTEQALNGTTILNTQAIMNGASILRVHDVREAREILQLLF